MKTAHYKLYYNQSKMRLVNEIVFTWYLVQRQHVQAIISNKRVFFPWWRVLLVTAPGTAKRIIPRPQTYDSCLSSGGSDEATVPVTTFTQPVKPGKSLTHVYKILDTSWHCPHAMQYSYDSPATLENLPHSESWLLRLDCLNIVGSLNIFISEMNRSHCKL